MPRLLSLALVLIFLTALSAAAQSTDTSSSAPPPQAKDAVPSADAPKPKKVWTNENLSGASGTVSVVGDEKSKQKPGNTKPADAQYIVSVRKQIEKHQADIADIDKQLADLKGFSEGEPSNKASGIKLNKSYNREPIEVQIRVLQDQKKDLEAKIDALLEEARKKGVEPGQLR